MYKAHFTEHQIIAVIKPVEVGRTIKDVCQAVAKRYPRYGFPKLFPVLRRQGYSWNHKRIHRIYCLLKLNFRRNGKQRLLVRNPLPRLKC